MPTYVVTARDTKGNPRKEKISAESPGEARTALRERGLFVQELREDQGLVQKLSSLDMKEIQNAMVERDG